MDEADKRESKTTTAAPLSRRAFVVGTVAGGFALAVLPVSAQTITTDTKGLTAGEVRITTADGVFPAYLAMPARGGPFPTVIVVHEIFGVHEHIKDICRRLAKAGYFAVAPALYARQGDVTKTSDMKDVMKIVSQVPDSQVASDLDATVAWAEGTGRANTAKLGIVGFCWGGRQVWLYAAHNPKLKAGVAWYGVLNWSKSKLSPTNPIDLVPQINAPVLGLYGGADEHIPVSQVEKLQLSLKGAGKPSEIVVYPDTPHGFNADYRPSYRPRQAKDGWRRMLAWFKDHGVA